MFSSAGTNSTGSNGSNGPVSLTDLKAELTTLTSEVTRLVEERARRAAEMAEAGVDATRETVSDYPLASLAAAFAVGALLGLAFTTPARTTRSWTGSDMRNDLSNYAEELRRTIRSTASSTSMADNLERLSTALSAVDAKASVGPAIDRILGWFSQARAVAKDAMSKATA